MELTEEAQDLIYLPGRSDVFCVGMEKSITDPKIIAAQGLVPAADSMPLSEVILFAEWIGKGSWVLVTHDITRSGDFWVNGLMGGKDYKRLSTPDLIKAFKNRNL